MDLSNNNINKSKKPKDKETKKPPTFGTLERCPLTVVLWEVFTAAARRLGAHHGGVVIRLTRAPPHLTRQGDRAAGRYLGVVGLMLLETG